VPHISSIQVQEDIRFDVKTNYLGFSENLYLDLFLPVDGSNDKRPVVMIMHGGFFVFGSKDDAYIDSIALDLSRRGYIAVPVGYRVGANLFSPEIEKDIARAAIRSVHDLKSAIAFLRESVEEGDPYRIDPEQIFVLGYSAGAFSGMSVQFLDEEDELSGLAAEVIDELGGMHGDSGPANRSRIKAGAFLSGGIMDTLWIDKGEGNSLFVHGLLDDVISPYYDTVNFLGTPIIPLLGSVLSHTRQRHEGNRSELFLMGNADHYWPLYEDSYVQGMDIVFDWLARQVDCKELMARNNEMHLYPVPVADHLWIHLQEGAVLGGELHIYDIRGSLVWSSGPMEFPYLLLEDMSHWTNGTYYAMYVTPLGYNYEPSLFIKL
jgi:hypothetical protein